MTHFLDTLPLDFSRPESRELVRLLAETYYREPRIETMVRAAGISPAAVSWGQPSRDLWRDVLDKARNQGRLRVLLEQIVSSEDVNVGERVAELLTSAPVTEPLAANGALDWTSSAVLDEPGEVERQLEAESTLLDIAFLARGLELAPAVARLLVTTGSARYYGTAFRIGADLLLTNHHVLFPESGRPATSAEAWFGYESTFDGALRQPVVIRTDPRTITGASDHDWAVVRTVDPMPDGVPVISLVDEPASPVKLHDRVYIIQHPLGGTKKIGMVHNVVRYLDDDVIGYRTDTEGGSSGSPVFDESWRLVALHHKWEARRIGGRREVLNQGRRIAKVRAALVAARVVDA